MRAKLMQDRERRLVVADQHGLGDLELEPVGCEGPESASALAIFSASVSAFELDRRDVDRERAHDAGQVAASAQAVRSTHSPSSTIRPVSSATGMNSAGEIMPRSRMAPAQQRLAAGHLVGMQIDQRLVVDLEAAIDERLAQIQLQREPRLGAGHPSPARRSDRCARPSALAPYIARSAFLIS